MSGFALNHRLKQTIHLAELDVTRDCDRTQTICHILHGIYQGIFVTEMILVEYSQENVNWPLEQNSLSKIK